MWYKGILIKLVLVFIVIAGVKAQSNATTENDTLFYALPTDEFIPAFDDYATIEDKMSCLEKEIPLNFNVKVNAFVNYFGVKDRVYTRRMLERQAYFFPIFEKYLKKYDLPDELKYLSLIESGLNPKAKSRAKAVGLWQFMYPTGKYYGLHIDNFIDERMDPEASTDAACRYLKKLHAMFGDWELALAAYNSGPGAVKRAIRKSGYKKSFWEVYPYLYRETRSYVPQFVAILYVMQYAEGYNFNDIEYRHAVASDTVLVKSHVHLATLANQLNLCEEEIVNLNPGIRYTAKPKTSKAYSIRIPAHYKPLFNENRENIVDTVAKVGVKELHVKAKNDAGSTYGKDMIVYRVRSGDVLGKIAMRYKVSVVSLRRWNNLRGDMIRAGQKLKIYMNPAAAKKYEASAKSAPAKKIVPAQNIDGKIIYHVQPGDTLWDISKKYNGMSIERIKQLNNLTSDQLKPGQKLILG